ncbi:hypothetical protein BDFB_000620 [Asbolus verrucosus]|uniref:DUF4706 domain-containing protein n=1 Tax=Asbolus verrucosus TaxID=1661398 RepID=A0A482VGZ7_ASBVE|nr:hypothetical protein BDFB_000620 [Asbolus verrucosus]
MSLESVAEDYFSKLNPIARRMYADMKETKLAYEELWDTISEKEQKEILSESIITPEVLIKYKQNQTDNSIKEYAVKFIIDDHCSYPDEHSGPFTFKTRSQRDLSLFERDRDIQVFTAQPQEMLKHKPKKIMQVLLDDDVPEFAHEDESSGNALPKTGLDFLDNCASRFGPKARPESAAETGAETWTTGVGASGLECRIQPHEATPVLKMHADGIGQVCQIRIRREVGPVLAPEPLAQFRRNQSTGPLRPSTTRLTHVCEIRLQLDDVTKLFCPTIDQQPMNRLQKART